VVLLLYPFYCKMKGVMCHWNSHAGVQPVTFVLGRPVDLCVVTASAGSFILKVFCVEVMILHCKLKGILCLD